MEYVHLLNNVLLVEELFSFVFLVNIFMISYNRFRRYTGLITMEQEDSKNVTNIIAMIITCFVLFIADVFRVVLMTDFTILIKHPFPKHVFFYGFSIIELFVLLALMILVIMLVKPIRKHDEEWLDTKGKKVFNAISFLLFFEAVLICLRFLVF